MKTNGLGIIHEFSHKKIFQKFFLQSISQINFNEREAKKIYFMTKLTNKPFHPHTIEFVKNRANAAKRNKNRKIYFYEVVDSLATTEEIFNKANQDYFIKRN